MQTKQLTVLNKLGLHARPCALLAKTAGCFKSSITLTHNNHSVDAKSILGLMTMAVPAGTTLTITTEGPDEVSAVKDIAALFANKFGEQA
jgi:phosphocarrier protein HPr